MIIKVWNLPCVHMVLNDVAMVTYYAELFFIDNKIKCAKLSFWLNMEVLSKQNLETYSTWNIHVYFTKGSQKEISNLVNLCPLVLSLGASFFEWDSLSSQSVQGEYEVGLGTVEQEAAMTKYQLRSIYKRLWNIYCTRGSNKQLIWTASSRQK